MDTDMPGIAPDAPTGTDREPVESTTDATKGDHRRHGAGRPPSRSPIRRTAGRRIVIAVHRFRDMVRRPRVRLVRHQSVGDGQAI